MDFKISKACFDWVRNAVGKSKILISGGLEKPGELKVFRKNESYKFGDLDYIFVQLSCDDNSELCFFVDEVIQECSTKGWVLVFVCSGILAFVNEGALPFKSNVMASRQELVGILETSFIQIRIVHGRQAAFRGMTDGGKASIVRFNVVFKNIESIFSNLFSIEPGSSVEIK